LTVSEGARLPCMQQRAHVAAHQLAPVSTGCPGLLGCSGPGGCHWLGGRLVLGPWSGEGASGWVPWALLAVRCAAARRRGPAGAGAWPWRSMPFIGRPGVPCSSLFGLFEWQRKGHAALRQRLRPFVFAASPPKTRASSRGVCPRHDLWKIAGNATEPYGGAASTGRARADLPVPPPPAAAERPRRVSPQPTPPHHARRPGFTSPHQRAGHARRLRRRVMAPSPRLVPPGIISSHLIFP
jgi:hypothetical protein